MNWSWASLHENMETVDVDYRLQWPRPRLIGTTRKIKVGSSVYKCAPFNAYFFVITFQYDSTLIFCQRISLSTMSEIPSKIRALDHLIDCITSRIALRLA